MVQTTIALAILIGGSGLAIAHQVFRTTDRTQAIADDAALAGLHALVGPDNRVNLAKFDDASKAAHRAAESGGFQLAGVTPFADGASFSVASAKPPGPPYIRLPSIMTSSVAKRSIGRLSRRD